jgi:hypothetical protein
MTTVISAATAAVARSAAQHIGSPALFLPLLGRVHVATSRAS